MAELDVKNKINKFSYITGTLRRTLKNKAQPSSIMKLYKSMAVPVIKYCSETWTMTEEHKRQVQSVEMRFLRSIAGYTLWDRQTNKSIREQLNIKQLNQIIDDNRNNWQQHLHRMEHTRYPRIAQQYRPQGHRPLGRPKKRWSDQF